MPRLTARWLRGERVTCWESSRHLSGHSDSSVSRLRRDQRVLSVLTGDWHGMRGSQWQDVPMFAVRAGPWSLAGRGGEYRTSLGRAGRLAVERLKKINDSSSSSSSSICSGIAEIVCNTRTCCCTSVVRPRAYTGSLQQASVELTSSSDKWSVLQSLYNESSPSALPWDDILFTFLSLADWSSKHPWDWRLLSSSATLSKQTINFYSKIRDQCPADRKLESVLHPLPVTLTVKWGAFKHSCHHLINNQIIGACVHNWSHNVEWLVILCDY